MPIAKNSALNSRLAATPVHRELMEWLNGELAQEREAYETTPATEGQRQRVLVLRELIDALKDK